MKRRDFIVNGMMIGGAISLGLGHPYPALAEKRRVGGTLVWGHSETTQNLDMHLSRAASSNRVLFNIHDSIVTIDRNLNVVPKLASHFEVSDDGLIYTFRLREGVTFHNGKIMNSNDAKYSFERCRNPETGAVNSDVFVDVDQIETPDELTVVIRMVRPYSPFLARLAENGAGVIMPAGSGDQQETSPLGAGPFRFVRREFGNEIVLERFDDYWGGPAFLDRVIAREITEPSVRLTGLMTGELHLINDVPPERLDQLRNNETVSVYSWSPVNFDVINFNHNLPLFQDKRVRLAFDLIIDKEALLLGALWGQGEVTATPSFPRDNSRNGQLKARSQDLTRARDLLSEAGHLPGSLSIVFKVTSNYPYHVEAAQIIAEWAREAGVTVIIEQLTMADWLSQVWVDREFEMTMMNFASLWEPDRLYYNLFHSNGRFNYRNIDRKKLDELTTLARSEPEPTIRLELYKEVQEYVHENVIDIFLWYSNGAVAANNSVSGIETLIHHNASNFNFHQVQLTS